MYSYKDVLFPEHRGYSAIIPPLTGHYAMMLTSDVCNIHGD